MYGWIVAQRTLLATKTRPIMLTMRQTRTLHSVCNKTCWRRALQTTAPSLHPYRPTACTETLAVVHVRYYSSPPQKQSSTQRIKVVLREYGVVAVVFHTVMSLTSLGTCYLIVSSGVDVGKVLEYFNVQSSTTSKGASTFAVAYVLHKMLLPLRAGITVASVPLIVRWLRARGWVRGVAKQVQPK